MKQVLFSIIILSFLLTITSCKKEDSPTEPSAYGNITGTITDQITSNPLAKVSVFTDPATSFVSTDELGNYKISTVNPGEYTVTAVKLGYDTLVVGVNVAADAASVADFIMTLEDSISNQKFGTVEGTIFDSESGQTVTSVNLTTNPATNSIRSDNAGKYKFDNLLPGEYELTAEKTGFNSNTINVMVRAGITTQSDIEIIKKDTSTADQKGTLQGKVLDSVTEKPIANVLVETTPSYGSVLTDSQGNYSLKDLPVGEYEVDVSKTYYLKSTSELSITGGKTIEANFSLTPTIGSVSGIVIDSLGAPIQFVEITTNPETSAFITDAEGKVLLTQSPIGALEIIAKKSGYAERSIEIVVEAGKTTEFVLILE